MKRYIALLRGINISGKNKIVMSELKTAFEKLGFTDVKTHLNSGNVIFSAEKSFTSDEIKEMISESFGVQTEVYVTDSEKVADILQNAPEWWGTADKDIYDNLIFWSFDRKNYAKANWWKKTASAGIGEFLTIRTANTVRKIAELCK